MINIIGKTSYTDILAPLACACSSWRIKIIDCREHLPGHASRRTSRAGKTETDRGRGLRATETAGMTCTAASILFFGNSVNY